MIIFICGPVAAGKTTLATRMVSEQRRSFLVDADEVQAQNMLRPDFSLAGRARHAENIASLLERLYRPSETMIAAFCLPLLSMRDVLRERLVGLPTLFLWLDTPLSVCIQRDPKGLYRRKTANLPGVSFPLERPNPDEPRTLIIAPVA